MTMQFGMPTLLETKSLEACAILCRELELNFVELNMCLPEYQADKFNIELLSEIADRNNIYYTIHLDDCNTPCDFNNKIAEAYTETVVQMIETARQLKMPVLNMHLHPGTYFTLPDRKVFLFDEYEHEYLRKLIAFREICEKTIGNADIKICVENCGDFENKQYVQKGLKLLLESSIFALTLDVGHNASADYSDEPTIMKYIDKLHHMHLHDASSRSNHLILGDGNVDLEKYLGLAVQHNCRTVLEVKTVAGLKTSVKWLKERDYL